LVRILAYMGGEPAINLPVKTTRFFNKLVLWEGCASGRTPPRSVQRLRLRSFEEGGMDDEVSHCRFPLGK
jgi:hypothetical protein